MGSGKGKTRRLNTRLASTTKPYVTDLAKEFMVPSHLRQLHEPSLLVNVEEEENYQWRLYLCVFLDLKTDELVLLRIEAPPTGIGVTTQREVSYSGIRSVQRVCQHAKSIQESMQEDYRLEHEFQLSEVDFGLQWLRDRISRYEDITTVPAEIIRF